jgi:predicted DNA-binding transcriptional regulator AlpA
VVLSFSMTREPLDERDIRVMTLQNEITSAQTEAERRRRQAAQEAARGHRDRILTFRMWCAVNGFSLATGRRILKGDGPKPPIVQLSPRRIGIRESDNTAWQASRVR